MRDRIRNRPRATLDPAASRLARLRRALVSTSLTLAVGAVPAVVTTSLATPPAGAATSESATWTQQSPAASPSGRELPAAAFDQATGRLVVFGGGTSSGQDFGDTWSWDGSNWQQLSPTHSPAARSAAAMTYDPGIGGLILFGGHDANNTFYGDTWVWSNGDWTQLSPVHSPPALMGASLAYDSATGQVVLFGGYDSNGDASNQTWVWDNSESDWLQMAPVHSPEGRRFAPMTFDPATGQLLMYGGFDTSPLGDTWTWTGSDWVQESPSTSPGPLLGSSMDFDPATGDALLFGGLDSNFSPTGASWAWNGSDWRQLTPASAPDARSLAAEVFDPATASLVLFGGESSAGTELSDTWNFGVAGTPVWQGAYTGGPDDLGPAMAHDDATGQTVLFGGLNTSADNMDSWTWVWDGTAWNQVADADQAGCRNTCLNAPPARTGATMAFDATTGQLLLFGGYSETAGQAYQMYTDTWSWDGTTWSQLASSQGGLSWSGSMVYDGATGQMLMIQTDGATTTTYEWSGSSWTLLRPAHQPAPVGNSAIAYDPANGTVALFGGIDNGGLDFDNSTWIWNGTDWAQVGDSPTGCSAECESSPPGVEGAQMAFDPATDRLVLAGGEDLDGPLADVWAWDGSSWTDAGAAPHAPTSELAYDPAHGTILEHDDASTWTYQVATPPGAPAISSATPGAEQVTLDWTAPASDGGSPVTGYDVYVGTSSGGESGQPVNPSLLAADTSSYTVTGLSDSTTYFFTVKAVNAAGTGSPSDEMSASTPGRPTMPQSVTATGGSGQLTAHWAAPSDTGGSPITDYLVTVTADEIGGSSTVHDVDSASATSYTVTGLTPGTVYGVKVSAVNAVGAGPDSLGYGVVVYGPPGPATAITATPGDASVVLRWTPPPTDDGSPILGWEIYEGTSPGSISSAPVNRAPLPGSATSYTVGSLQNGRSYYFIVRSYNLGGPSPAPGLVSATPNATGYLVVTANGVVASHGAVAYGSPAGLHLASPIVGAASAGGAGGYFLAGADGGVFNYGPGARFHGSAGNLRLVAPIVGMAVDPATGGYWLVASDGGIFNYGAPFYGSMGGTRLTAPIVGMTPAPDGRGYWLVAADGGVFALGPGAHFRGSAAAYHPAAPVTAMAGDPMTGGYWVAASDGHVYAFGAPSGGSLGGRSGSSALSGIAFNPSTAGYWLVDAAGRTYSGTTPVSANPVGGRAVAILPG